MSLFTPLDPVNGEPYDDRPRDPVTNEPTGPGRLFGARYVVIEPSDLFRHDIRVTFEPPVLPGKFRPRSRKRKPYRHIVDDVLDEAAALFTGKGAMPDHRGLPINEDDILVQVYPDALKVVVHVQRVVRGEWMVASLVYPQGDEVWSPTVIDVLLQGAGKKTIIRH